MSDQISLSELFGFDKPNPTSNPTSKFETLSVARDWLQDNLNDGVRCPCCDKFARRYRRKFNATMSRSLIWLVREWQASGETWVDVPKIAPRTIVRSNQLPTIRWWGMAERPVNTDNPDLKHSGLWRPTEKGVSFALRQIKVPSTAITYDGNVESLEGDLVSIEDSLGVKFCYADLMSGANL